MCEHKWTIVYIDSEPIGISCEHCEIARPIGRPEDPAPPILALLPGGIYRIPTGTVEYWELSNWQVQNELNRPSYMSLEFRQAHPGTVERL